MKPVILAGGLGTRSGEEYIFYLIAGLFPWQ
jgi:hypothetical protein